MSSRDKLMRSSKAELVDEINRLEGLCRVFEERAHNYCQELHALSQGGDEGDAARLVMAEKKAGEWESKFEGLSHAFVILADRLADA